MAHCRLMGAGASMKRAGKKHGRGKGCWGGQDHRDEKPQQLLWNCLIPEGSSKPYPQYKPYNLIILFYLLVGTNACRTNLALTSKVKWRAWIPPGAQVQM